MKTAVRAAFCVLASAALLFASRVDVARASTADLEFHDCAYETGLGDGECQHFLRNPNGATDEPCWCDKCRNAIPSQKHDGHTIPPGWNPQLMETGGTEVYLKRNAVAWGITCSECYQNDKPWPDGKSEKDPGTIPENDAQGRPAKETVMKRLAKERGLFKKPSSNLVVAYNKHFYVVTDIDPIKVKMPGGSSRVVSTHEYAHLLIERAEFARREWDRNLGDAMISKPLAIFLIEKQREIERVNAEYFGSPNSDALNGSGDKVCDGFCNSGQSMSHQKVGDDHELQVHLRHMLAHNLLTCWATHEIRPKSLPVWISEGLAHWLTRTLDKFKDDCTVCQGEGAGGNGKGKGGGTVEISGKSWEDDVLKLAQNPALDPIEKLLSKEVVGKDFTPDDHRRAWSYIDLCLKEWREPFVKLLAALRQEKDVRESFMTTLGCTPETFDERWRERVIGHRKSMAPTAAESEPENADTPGARDRRKLVAEQNNVTLAALIRQLGVLTDKKTVRCVVDLMARNNDLVRETALVTLLKVNDLDCQDALWNYGLGHDDGVVRAYTARICGRQALVMSLPKLEAMLDDKNWYARAEAAVACGMMKDPKAQPGLRKMVISDPSEKARIGAMDALAMYHEDAAMAVPLIAKMLDHAQWQLRITAAGALGEIGSMEAVDPLITRMLVEKGRVNDDIYEALKKLSRDDLGRKAENWKTWWERAKSMSPNGLPQRPPPPDPKKKPKDDPNDPHATHDGGPPPYFGLEIYSNRVGFVFDTSASMATLFTPDKSAAKALTREYVGRDKLTICKEEIAQALAGLDPRAHFNLVAFGTMIRAFKPNPVQATPANIQSAIDFMKAVPAAGETNYYDALKAALDIGAEPDTNPNLKATPDTITFLTDGVPTKGDIIDADTLLEWYSGLNRYSRVKTHTITFGTIDVDLLVLKNLAERNGGKFTLVPEAPPKK